MRYLNKGFDKPVWESVSLDECGAAFATLDMELTFSPVFIFSETPERSGYLTGNTLCI